MSTSVSIGFSQDPDCETAVLQACIQVKNQLNSVNTDLVLVLATPQYAVPEIQPVITRTLRPKCLVGTSTGAVISSDSVTSRGLVVVGINSNEIIFGASAVDLTGRELRDAGFELARKASQSLKTPHREVLITFSEGVEKNASHFIKGLRESLGAVFPVIGAVSSDDFKYKDLSQLFHDQILHNSAVGLLVGGVSKLALGCRHSFTPLGKPRTVTSVEGIVIRTIDDRPAVDIYRHFLGSETEKLKHSKLNSLAALYPLGIYLEEPGEYLLRNVVDILNDGSIVCHEGVPQGAEVHLMISNKGSCHVSAIEAAESVKAALADKPAKLVLIIESLLRYKILGNSAFNEIQAIKDVLGHTTPLICMYSYGEIGPFGGLSNIKNIYLHNSSILIAAIS